MAAPIPFSQIPQNNLPPFYFVEFDNSNAGVAGGETQNSLMIGQTINAVPAVVTYVPSAQWAANYFGAGSQLAIMAAAYYMGDPEGQLYALPLADAAGATAAAGSIAFTGPATGNGTLFIMIAGREVQVGVTSGMTAIQIAAAVVAAVNAYLDPNGMALPVTAAIDGTHAYQADFTARNKGAVGNQIFLGLNFWGSANGEALPAGVGATVTAMTGGATDPDLGSTYLSAPASAPTLTPSSSGGSLATGTVYVKVTYVNAAGETIASSEASASVTSSGSVGSVGVASPASVTGAIGYNVYASLATGAETKQNAYPIALGTAYTIQSIATGAALPAANTAATGGVALAMGTTNYDFVMLAGYTGTTQLNEVQTLMSFSSGRWSYSQQLFGHVWTAYQSTGYSGADLLTFGAGRNDPHMTAVGYEAGSPSTPFEVAASFCGAFAQASKADPGRPEQTLLCPNLIAAPSGARFGFNTEQALLSAGVALMQPHRDGSLTILRSVTTYQTNAWGQTDRSYLDATTLFEIMYYVRDQKANLTQKFPRAKLAADGTNFGQQGNLGADTPSVVTPNIVKAELVAEYTRMCPGGDLPTVCQDPAGYAAGLQVQINGSNPNRLDILDDPIFIGGLRMVGVVNQFRLIPPPAGG